MLNLRAQGPVFLFKTFPGGLGDSVTLYPVFQAIRTRWRGSPFLLATGNPAHLALAKHFGLVDAFHPEGQEPAWDYGDVDAGIVWTPRPRHWLLREYPGRFVTHTPLPSPENRSVMEHHLDALGKIGVEAPAPELVGRPQTPGRLAVLHPGASRRERCLPAPLFASAARRLKEKGWDAVVALGPSEEDLAGAFEGLRIVRPGTCVELGALLERAALFLGNNSGPGHLAAWCGASSLILHRTPADGASDPEGHRRCWAARGAATENVLVPTDEDARGAVKRWLDALPVAGAGQKIGVKITPTPALVST